MNNWKNFYARTNIARLYDKYISVVTYVLKSNNLRLSRIRGRLLQLKTGQLNPPCIRLEYVGGARATHAHDALGGLILKVVTRE